MSTGCTGSLMQLCVLAQCFPTFRRIVVPSLAWSIDPSGILLRLLDRDTWNFETYGTPHSTAQLQTPGDLNPR